MAITNTGLGVEYNSSDEFYTYILNDLFLPAVADTVINPNVLLRSIPRDSTHVEGKNVVFPIHIGRNLGVNSIAPEGLLPDPGQQAYNRYAFMVRHIYGRVKFSGIALDASRSQIASWLNLLQSEVEGLATDMARYRQRIYHNDGSGRLGEYVSGTTTVVVRAPSQIPGSTTDYDPVKHFKIGQRVALINDPTGTPALDSQAKTVTDVDHAAGTITINAAFSSATAGDAIVLASTLDTITINDTTWQNDPMGIAGIVYDSDPLDGTAVGHMGVDSSDDTYSWHRANMSGDLQNGGTTRALTMQLMDLAFQTTQEVADMNPDMGICSFGVLRAFAARILTDRRFAGSSEPQAFDGGYSALSYNNMPLVPDRDCYSNRIYFLSMPGFRFHVMSEPRWIDMDGSIYHRIPDRDQYQATMFVRETLAHDVRDHNTLLLDIEEV